MLRIVYELDRRGMTQADCASKAGVNKASMNRICNGKEPPYPQRAKRIAEALGWEGDPAALFEEIEVR